MSLPDIGPINDLMTTIAAVLNQTGSTEDGGSQQFVPKEQ